MAKTQEKPDAVSTAEDLLKWLEGERNLLSNTASFMPDVEEHGNTMKVAKAIDMVVEYIELSKNLMIVVGNSKKPEKPDKPLKAKIYKTYECRIEEYFKDGSDLVSNHIANSHSSARYAFWRSHSEVLSRFEECMGAIKTKSLGAIHPLQFYGPEDDFKRMCELRSIQFAYQGMVVDVAGKKGWLVGNNNSLNMDVLFEGADHISNCHPYWETTFYDDHMNVVKDFKKLKQKEETH